MAALDAQSLLDKLLALPREKLAEIEDFIDFLREREHREPLREAIRRGRIVPPAIGGRRSSVAESPPVAVPGTPASEVVLKDRR